MPLQIRRGTTAQRLAIRPLIGELVYDTTTGQLFVGDSTDGGVTGTLGGATTTGISTEDAQDAAAALFQTGSHSGITFAYNDAAGRIDATVTVAATGPFDGDLTGSVFADNSTLLVDGTGGRLVGPLATSGLADNLPVNGFSIVSTSNGNINISPNGTGQVLINSGLTITGSVTKAGNLLVNTTGGGALQLGTSITNVDGNLVIIRNTYSANPLSGFFFSQHHSNQQAVNFTLYRTRGSGLATQQLVDGDEIAGFDFVGQGPSSTTPVGGAALTIAVDGTPSVGNVPTKFQFGTNNGSSNAVRAELSASGIWKVDSIQALSGTLSITGNLDGDITGSVFADDSTILVDATNGVLRGNFIGSVFADDSTRIIDGTDGSITATSVAISNTGYLQMPVYANDAARSAAIPTPATGMMIFVQTGTSPLAVDALQVYNGSAWINV